MEDNIQNSDTISEKNRKMEIDRSDVTKKSYGKLTKGMFAWLIAVTIIVSSLFGAVFGFMSASTVNIFSFKIGQKIGQYFPNLDLKKINPQVSKQQVVVEDSAVIDV